MKNTEKFLTIQKEHSIKRIREYRNLIKGEESKIRFINKCLEELENETRTKK